MMCLLIPLIAPSIFSNGYLISMVFIDKF